MPDLKLVYGRLSKHYNHFREYNLVSCEATDTRLMGVLALRITWSAKDGSNSRYYQIMHLDYSEYGVDDYYEFECIPGSEDFRREFDDMKNHWHDFTSVMGGRIVRLPAEVMVKLIDEALEYAGNDRVRPFDIPGNEVFREYAVLRLGLMKTALAEDGLITDDYSDEEVMAMVCPGELAACETINYFLMRLVDLDFHAASYLSAMTEDELRNCQLTRVGMQTLMRNQIRQGDNEEDIPSDGMSVPYRCTMTTQTSYEYFLSTFVIYLDADYRFKNSKVTEVRVGTVTHLTEYETAIKLKQTEYVTVYDISDRLMNNFDPDTIPFMVGVAPSETPNGWLYIIYNDRNDHVNSIDYRLNGDMYGCVLLSIPGELIIMSNKIRNISDMEDGLDLCQHAAEIELDGRYELREPIFQTLCQAQGYTFRRLLDYSE